MKKPVLALIFILGVLMFSSVIIATYFSDSTGLAGAAPVADAGEYGVNIMTNIKNNTLVSATKYATDTSTIAYLKYPNGTLIEQANFSGDVANFSSRPQLFFGINYSVTANKGGASRNVVCTSANWGGPIVGNGVNFTGVFNGCASPTKPGSILSIQTENLSEPPPPNTTIITLAVRNLVNGSVHTEGVTFVNVTGSLSFFFYNITSNGFCVTYSGNGTGTNCTASNGASRYYNVTNATTITGSQTVFGQTFEALISLQAYRLFLNTSIASFNATNNIVTNQTSSGTLQVLANNGTNNIKVDVQGNYSVNVTCTAVTLTTSSCNATGVYDDKFTIGATNQTSGGGVTSFTGTVTNTTLFGTLTASTTTGNITWPLLQGYTYNFSVNKTGLEYATILLPANASTNLYNFSLRTENSFNFTFLNETSNAKITENITLQVYSGAYAANYTVTGGSQELTLLTPGDYQFTYWLDPDVPRNYYYTLSSQSYNNINLYIVDADISNLYLPVVINQNALPQQNITVSLLRDYILSGNTHEYRIVQMARTDTNGQAVLRVVPNIIAYKLIISDGTNTLATTPTEFTSNTNTYTLNTQSSPVASLVGIPGITRALTFDNTTLTYTFTWSDSENIVTEGCLVVLKFHNSIQSTDLSSCTSGSAGSITHTLNDTNSTRYIATATLNTNTPYSTLPAGSLAVDFDSTWTVFGLVGFVIAFILFLTFTFIGGESGIAGMMVAGAVSLLLLGAFGFVYNAFGAVVGIIIVIGIILYRLRGA